MATPTRVRQLIGGVWRYVTADEGAGGGSLPDPVTDPVNIAVDSDVVGLTVTAPAAGSANILEVIPDDPSSTLAIDNNSRFRKDAFAFIASLAGGGSSFSIPGTATFEIDNDDTGDPILKVTAGPPNVVEIGGVPITQGFPALLDDGDDVRISSSSDSTTNIVFQRSGGNLIMSGSKAGVPNWFLDSEGVFSSAAGGPFALSNAPVVPATPTAQDIVDALVTLGLVTQAA